jgi:hypothetical protein
MAMSVEHFTPILVVICSFVVAHWNPLCKTAGAFSHCGILLACAEYSCYLNYQAPFVTKLKLCQENYQVLNLKDPCPCYHDRLLS